MKRYHSLPEKPPEEPNLDWCKRAAASIPPEALLREIMLYLTRRAKRKGVPPWSEVGDLTGHGSGVASAIYERFKPEDE